jgi:hypothetical protein
MKYAVLAAAALLASTGLAGAADLAKRAPAPVVQAAPVSPFDAFVSFGLGYGFGEMGNEDNSGFAVETRGSFEANFAGSYGAQVDAAYSKAWNDSDAYGDNSPTDATVAGHLFWRDQRVASFGVITQYTSSKTKFDNYGTYATDNYFAGVEGQYFFGPLTAYLQAAYHYADSDALGDGDGFTVAGQLRYFATPDWKFALKGSYDTVSLQETDKDTWSVGLRTDYRLGQLATLPVDLYAEVAYSEAKYDSLSIDKDQDTKVMVGVTFNFDSSKSLLERDRNGASFDALPTAGAF